MGTENDSAEEAEFTIDELREAMDGGMDVEQALKQATERRRIEKEKDQ